jgi:uncharacterized membrane protein YeiB
MRQPTMESVHSLSPHADRARWWFIRLFIDGTPRDLLQFLIGAGAVILLERTFPPDRQVAFVDVYLRRNV